MPTGALGVEISGSTGSVKSNLGGLITRAWTLQLRRYGLSIALHLCWLGLQAGAAFIWAGNGPTLQ